MTQYTKKEKNEARAIAAKAQADGILKKQPCEGCLSEKRVEKHHEDYGKPLDVRWVCRRCHSRIHMFGIQWLGKHDVRVLQRQREDQELEPITRWIRKMWGLEIV